MDNDKEASEVLEFLLLLLRSAVVCVGIKIIDAAVAVDIKVESRGNTGPSGL